MNKDLWHYPRTALASQVLNMFASGLSSALVFFAPRRMGKTEFLLKDILPLAQDHHWRVFYFSFFEAGSLAEAEFIKALLGFMENTGISGKAGGLLQKITKISGEAVGIKAGVELRDSSSSAHTTNLRETMTELAKRGNTLLLMDEVQVLAQDSANANFVAALRTALDVHKDTIKVIFTGSSQEGLRRMFSQAKAPFFHFGQNLLFPELDKGFTDHLASLFEKITQRALDHDALWTVFQETQKIPQLARGLVERLVLNPQLTLQAAKEQLLTEVFDDRAFIDRWEQCSLLERLLIQEVALGVSALFSVETRERLAATLGIDHLAVSSVQSAVRILQRKGIIGRFPERGTYYIDDPHFKNWLRHKEEDR